MLRSETLVLTRLLNTFSLLASNASTHPSNASNLSNAPFSHSPQSLFFDEEDGDSVSFLSGFTTTHEDDLDVDATDADVAEQTETIPEKTAAEAIAIAATTSLMIPAISASAASPACAGAGDLDASRMETASLTRSFSILFWDRTEDASRASLRRRMAVWSSDWFCLREMRADRKEP